MTVRNRHYRTVDHSGILPSSKVVLSADIGPYTAGTSVNDVLAALLTQTISNYPLHSFTADAFMFATQAHSVVGWAVIKKTQTGTFTANARIA